MTLVDHECFVSLPWASIAEDVGLLGIPDLSAEDTRLAVLDYTACPCRDALSTAMAPADEEAVEVSMVQYLIGDMDLPVAIVIDTLELPDGHALPIVEGAYELDAMGTGEEFPEDPATLLLISVQAVVKVAIGELLQRDIPSLSDGSLTSVGELHATADALFIGLEPRVVCY
jgi:hypothetical protein